MSLRIFSGRGNEPVEDLPIATSRDSTGRDATGPDATPSVRDMPIFTGRDGASKHDLRIFDSVATPADAESLGQLAGGIAGADLAAPAIVLPDFHHKSNMEMPSSIAVATRGTIRPTL